MEQTQFQEKQAALQAPPPPELTPEQEQQLLRKKKQQKKLFLIGLGTIGTLMFLTIILSVFRPQSTDQSLPTIDFPDASQSNPSSFTQRFQELKNQLDQYDPTDIELAPPPVNYNLQLEAANY